MSHSLQMEFQNKLKKVRTFLLSTGFDGIWLVEPENISWLTCGGNNRIDLTSPWGSFGLLVTQSQVVAIAGNNEMPRVEREEIGDLGIETLTFPWYEGYADLYAGKYSQGLKIAADRPSENFSFLGFEFSTLRYQLTSWEKERYRELARDTAQVLVETCEGIKPGFSEYKIAALVAKGFRELNIIPFVLLSAADERIGKFRHPIPTEKTVEKTAMISICGQRHGLVVSQTRLVNFGKVSEDLLSRHHAVAQIEAEMFAQTYEGNSFKNIFSKTVSVYERLGYPSEWKLHHQGGPAGYKGREDVINPASAGKVLLDQAFAWNPTIAGTKAEDTIIATASRPEILGQVSNWPYFDVRVGTQVYQRPDILVR
jgi:Xaa-Pro dipeptidase